MKRNEGSIIAISSHDALDQAVRAIRRGDTIVFPTETAYGLGCDATSASAVAKIFAIKNRPASKSLPVIVGSIAMVKKYVRWNECAHNLAKKWWPGPLTLQLVANRTLPVVASDGSLALRVPAMEFIRLLSLRSGVPLVATSANSAGGKTRYSIRGVLHELARSAVQPDLIIDGGRLPRRKPSTIVDARTLKPVIVRQGSIHI